MSVELEAKIKVDSHEPIRSALAGAGGRCLGRVREINHIFDNADRTLLAGGCGLRIRESRPEAGGRASATMTYKGVKLPGPLKQREEVEVSIDDAEAGRGLLQGLGFVETVCFEKRRESWDLGECRIELDEVPHLGLYVEIEGPDEPAIRRAQDAIGLTGRETIRRSYISLLVEHCRQAGLPTDTITFPKNRSSD